MKFNNNYYILRHGEAKSNVKNIISCWPEKFRNPLTERGRKQIRAAAKKLENIDLIFASDVLRTKQTAEIIARELKAKVKFDKRLREYKVGVLNGESTAKLREQLPSIKRFTEKPKGGETYVDIENRVYNFLKEINSKHKGKDILIISHQLPLIWLELKTKHSSKKELVKQYYANKEKRIKTGELRKL